MGGRATVTRPLAGFLRGYQLHGGYTPGPLLALATLAGLAGAVIALVGGLAAARGRSILSARQRELALACLLIFGSAVAVLLASDLFEFSWRYQLPALVTLAACGRARPAPLGSLRRRRAPAGHPPGRDENRRSYPVPAGSAALAGPHQADPTRLKLIRPTQPSLRRPRPTPPRPRLARRTD